MAKSTGLGSNFFIDGYDLSGDVGAVNTIAMRVATLDVTAINKSAMERVHGLRDGEISFNAFWNTAAGQAHVALKGQSTANRIASYLHGTTLGNPAASLVTKQIDFNSTRGADGSLASTIQTLAASGVGLEWGIQLTAGSDTHASATNGTSVNNGAATTTGAAAYLQVMSLGSGTLEIDIEDSANNSDFTSIIAFTNVTARGAQRVATAVGADVRQYVRVATSGTFSAAVIAVTFTRYPDPA